MGAAALEAKMVGVDCGASSSSSSPSMTPACDEDADDASPVAGVMKELVNRVNGFAGDEPAEGRVLGESSSSSSKLPLSPWSGAAILNNGEENDIPTR